MESPAQDPAANPPPLTVAASLATVQGLVLALLSILEFASLTSGRFALGVSTAGFFLAYAVVLLAAAWGLSRRNSWARGPVLLTQLICLGLAWNVRDQVPVAIALVVVALIVLAGLVHPRTIAALEVDPTAPRG